jgi:pyruvate/2-oxoglutarate dehydrogenase complex dihydrolipoamide acyltransferase (E2) component
MGSGRLLPKPAAIVAASDGAREHAQEHGVDLARIVGTGKAGLIILQDVKRYIKTRERQS